MASVYLLFTQANMAKKRAEGKDLAETRVCVQIIAGSVFFETEDKDLACSGRD